MLDCNEQLTNRGLRIVFICIGHCEDSLSVCSSNDVMTSCKVDLSSIKPRLYLFDCEPGVETHGKQI
jgi:hypothetical protein